MTLTILPQNRPITTLRTAPTNGQLAHPDLVAQLDPVAAPEHPLPVPDNTVKTLFYWAMDLNITQGARMVLLAVIRHVEWADGTGCKASIPTLAREAHQTKKTTIGHIKALIGAGLISRKRRMSKASETVLTTAQLASELPCTVSVETTLTSQRSGNASNQSSSSNPNNQLGTPDQIVNLKQGGPRTEDQDHGSTGSFSFLEEEGTRATVETSPSGQDTAPTPPTPPTPLPADQRVVLAQEWVEVHIAEVPPDAEIQGMLAYCWPVWKYPEHPHGWKYGPEAAFKHCTADFAARKKFRVDLVEHLAKKGPPPTDADGQLLKREVWCERGQHLTRNPVGVTMEDKGTGRWFSDQCSDHLMEV